ncbi:MAG: PGPGW domain-containing protein [Gammaproteobacteria bacterium]|nr:PGPGW domain-containing protein [Gammaproteobacteria bacterium]
MIRRLGVVSYRLAKRIVIAVIGGTILVGGIIMLVTPGPGVVIVLFGLAILAVEFTWARLWLKKVSHSVTPEGRSALRGRFRQIRARWVSRGNHRN